MQDKQVASAGTAVEEPILPEEHLEDAARLSAAVCESAHEELSRLTASSLFKSSHRCQALLRYVVESALKGKSGSLKERCIGIEVFGRDSNYDTSIDPVVRMTAAEVRKKLAQYYYDPANNSTVRIELRAGSYVPMFLSSGASPHAVDEVVSRVAEHDDAESEKHAGNPKHARHSVWPRRAGWWLAAAIAIAVVSVLLFRQFHPKQPDAFESFWAPVVTSPNPVLLCVGHRMLTRSIWDSDGTHGPNVMAGNDDQELFPVTALRDSITLANIAGLLRADKKAFSVRGQAFTTFEDLQKGPVVLLGAFNNDWTLRLTESMRFHFAKDSNNSARWIADREKPEARIGAIKSDMDYFTREDFALVARILDPQTKQPTILVAGITAAATHAAGDFLTNPAYLDAFSRTAPQNWQTKNLELLIAANIVNGDSGPPRVVESIIW